MEFRSNISFNSTLWQCPSSVLTTSYQHRACPSCIGAGADVVAKSFTCRRFCHDVGSDPGQNLNRRHVADVSPTCPSRDWNVLAVSGGFRRPRRARIYSGQTQDAARTRFLPWPDHVTGGFPQPKRGHFHHGAHEDQQAEDSSDF